MDIIIDYKRKVASRFIPIEGASTTLPDADEYIYSEKLDGHIAFAVVKDGTVTLYNRSAEILDLPSLAAAFPAAAEGIWAGELYLPQNNRSRSFMVASAIANDKDALAFAVFDAVHALDQPIFARMDMVKQMIAKEARVHPVHWQKSSAKKEVMGQYQQLLAQGCEGMVVYTSLGYAYKIKPILELDVAVLGYSLREDGTAIRALLVGVWQNNHWQVIASVGGGYSEELRKEWLDRLQPIECNADIVLVANNGLAYKWVTPQFVVQIKCIEAIAEDASGAIQSETLDFQEGKYHCLGKSFSVSLISPVYMGLRDDKTAGNDDCGFNQISDRVEIGASNKLFAENDSIAEPIFRMVYTKKSKNGTMLRKFVGIKTNKTIEEKYAPYVLYYTDFSAGRKEPLQTEINIAANEEILQQLLSQRIAENIKQGWVKQD